jgi:hypothetical protein
VVIGGEDQRQRTHPRPAERVEATPLPASCQGPGFRRDEQLIGVRT